MPELRWNPLEETWTIVVPEKGQYLSNKKNICPFCPGSDEIKNQYDVISLKNKFPIFNLNGRGISSLTNSFYKIGKAVGVSELILYSSRHTSKLGDLSISHILKVINLWIKRYCVSAKIPWVKYISIFENNGEPFWTLDHPHSQLCGFPFIPPIIKKELIISKKYLKILKLNYANQSLKNDYIIKVDMIKIQRK